MTLALYYHPFSSYSQKAVTAFYEKGVAFEARILDGSEPAQSAFATLWPIGKFPVLVDGERLVFDATSVIEDLVLGSGFVNPLDIVVGPGGAMYVAEWGGNKITFLKPDETPATSVTVTGISPSSGPITGGQAVTISGTNFTTTAETSVTIGGVSLPVRASQPWRTFESWR